MIWQIKSTGAKLAIGRKYSVQYRADGSLWVLQNRRWLETEIVPVTPPPPVNHAPVAGDATSTVKVQP